jgi:hypothetical protein
MWESILYCRTNFSLLGETLREEHEKRAYENRVLRKIFGSERNGVTGGCTRLFHNLYSSPNITRMTKPKRMRWAGNIACTETTQKTWV